jgi:hypothetical protein
MLNRVEERDDFSELGRADSKSLIGREMGNPGIELVWLVHPVNPLLI